MAQGLTSSLIRPRLRGVADIGAAAVAVPGVIALVDHARPDAARVAAVYGVAMVILLLGSAIYHRQGWSLRVALWLRKIDHANIYLMIAGSTTPLAHTLIPGPGADLIAVMWIAAALGVLKTLLWPRAPRGLSAGLYMLMGAIPIPFVGAIGRAIGPSRLAWLVAGGVIYAIGGVVYARRWPNPYPFTFGYHEIFHVFVFAAAAIHFFVIWEVVG